MQSPQFSFKAGSNHATFRRDNWTSPGSRLVATICKIFHRADADAFLEVFLHKVASEAAPGVVTFYDQFFEEGTLVLRMEFCPRESVAKEIEMRARTQQLFEFRFVAYAFKTCLETLIKLKAARIAHRQIDLTNMLISDTGEIKLADFGRAKLVETRNSVATHTVISQGVINSGESEEFNIFEEDAWSLGKAFYEICTLRPYRYQPSVAKDIIESDVAMKLTRASFASLAPAVVALLRANEGVTVEQAMDKLTGRMSSIGRMNETHEMEEDSQLTVHSYDQTVSISPATTLRPKVITLVPSCEACSSPITAACRALECQHYVCDNCVVVRSKELGRVVCIKCGKGPSVEQLGLRMDLSQEERDRWVKVIVLENGGETPIKSCSSCSHIHHVSGETTLKKCSICAKKDRRREAIK